MIIKRKVTLFIQDWLWEEFEKYIQLRASLKSKKSRMIAASIYSFLERSEEGKTWALKRSYNDKK